MSKVKISLSNLSKVDDIVKELSPYLQCSSIELSLYAPDNPGVDFYKTLSNLSKFYGIEWDIEKEESCCSGECSCEKKTIQQPQPQTINMLFNPEIEVTNYNELATFVEAVFRLSKISGNLIYGSSTYYVALHPIYRQVASECTVEHKLLEMIIDVYYQGVSSFSEALEDTITRLGEKWTELKNHPGITSVAKLLYSKN